MNVPDSGAIAGLKVLDLSRVLAGPYCAQILADHGARVVKVEPPQGDETRALGPPFVDGDSAAYYHAINRNKQAISLDLTLPAGREVLLTLLADADVLIENFLPGTMEKWGLGYAEVLSARFPRLVYCRVTGFGVDGPLGGLPGYDAVLQAMGGLMSINGEPASGPTRVGVPIVDIVTGLHATLGILLAINERHRSGRGQLVDVCLHDTALSLLIPHAANWFASGRVPGLGGSAHPNISPYDKFATADGEMFLGVVNDAQFRKFCQVLGRPEWASDARFADNAARLAHRAELKRAIEAEMQKHDSGDVCKRLMAAGVPAGPVRRVDAALSSEHAVHRAMKVEVGGQSLLGVPVKLARTPGEVRSAPPPFARDTREVLAGAGIDAAAQEKLATEGAIHLTRRGAGKR